MEMKNLSWNEKTSKNNHPLLPKSLRGLIVGESSCGKTTPSLNILLQPDWLDFQKLSVFGRSLFQPEYKILRKGFEEQLPKGLIMSLFENRDEIQGEGIPPDALLEELSKSNKRPRSRQQIECNFYESADDVPDLKEFSPEHKNLTMIFDDLLLQKQNKWDAWGRYSNCDCLYLSQNFFKLPHQAIRENANFFCLVPQDQKNINHIYTDHVSQDMSKDKFKQRLCKTAWSKPHNFVVIDLTSNKDAGKYRNGFDDFFM